MVSGCSAGGLATYLHVDAYAQRYPNTKVAGLPDSGFFLDYTSKNVYYHAQMSWVFLAQNASSGVDASCVEAHTATDDTWMCMFAEHTAEHISTPLFPLQSKYDSWQLGGNILYWGASDDERTAYGTELTNRFMNTVLANKQNGAFLDACYHHCGDYDSIGIDNFTQSTAFAQWYRGQISSNAFFNQNTSYPCDDCCSV